MSPVMSVHIYESVL